MTQEAATTTQQPIPADAPLTFRAGRATIALHRVHGGFHVLTMQGTRRVDEWSCSYLDEDEARSEARRAAKAFRHFHTADALAREYDRLTTAIDAREQRRANTGDLQRQRDAIQPLTAAARDRDLVARWTASRDLMLAIADLPLAERIDAVEAARDSFDATHPEI